MHDCVKNVFTIEKGGREFSLIPLQNEELSSRGLRFGRLVELKDFARFRDQCGQTWGTSRMDVKKKDWNKGKSVQVEDLEDMYVKN